MAFRVAILLQELSPSGSGVFVLNFCVLVQENMLCYCGSQWSPGRHMSQESGFSIHPLEKQKSTVWAFPAKLQSSGHLPWICAWLGRSLLFPAPSALPVSSSDRLPSGCPLSHPSSCSLQTGMPASYSTACMAAPPRSCLFLATPSCMVESWLLASMAASCFLIYHGGPTLILNDQELPTWPHIWLTLQCAFATSPICFTFFRMPSLVRTRVTHYTGVSAYPEYIVSPWVLVKSCSPFARAGSTTVN